MGLCMSAVLWSPVNSRVLYFHGYKDIFDDSAKKKRSVWRVGQGGCVAEEQKASLTTAEYLHWRH